MLEVAQKYLQLKSGEYYKCFGKVDKVVGLTIESIGPKAKLNDLCMIFLDKERRDYVMSEVVGFKDSHIILMPFDNVEGVGVGCIVENTGHPLTVAVGDELLGHTHKDLDKIADMSAEELKIITEKEVTAAKKDLSDALDEEITQKQDETKRSLEKEANSKIMAINEYSDTVLDSINKAHNEIMFLYSMLNDKHDELTRLSGDIDKASSRLRSSFEPLSADSAKRAEKPSVAVQKPAEPKSGTMQQDTKPDMKQMTGIDISGIIKTQPASAAPASKAGATATTGTAAAVSVKASDAAFGTPAGSSANADVINHTHEILKLYKSGKSNVEIAKLLSLGTGEVKLIIDLYKEGK